MLYEVITGSEAAIDQRVAILKAVFVEANRSSDDAFLDEGLSRYDRAGDEAKRLLQDVITSYSIHYTKLYDQGAF